MLSILKRTKVAFICDVCTGTIGEDVQSSNPAYNGMGNDPFVDAAESASFPLPVTGKREGGEKNATRLSLPVPSGYIKITECWSQGRAKLRVFPR